MPERLDDPLVAELAPLPGLAGRVLAHGDPVAGAELRVYRLARQRVIADDLPVWVEPRPLARGEADAEGRFELDLREAARILVRAEAPGHAPAELGPFDYDPALCSRRLMLELTAGGVRLPAGRVEVVRTDPWGEADLDSLPASAEAVVRAGETTRLDLDG